MNETVQQFLLNFGPALTILLSMAGICWKITRSLIKVVSESNLKNVSENIKNQIDDMKGTLNELKESNKALQIENAELRKKQLQLLEQLTRVKTGE